MSEHASYLRWYDDIVTMMLVMAVIDVMIVKINLMILIGSKMILMMRCIMNQMVILYLIMFMMSRMVLMILYLIISMMSWMILMMK